MESGSLVLPLLTSTTWIVQPASRTYSTPPSRWHSPQYPLYVQDAGWTSQASWEFWRKDNLWPVLRIRTRFFGMPVRSLVAILT